MHLSHTLSHVKNLLSRHFPEDYLMNRQFCHIRPERSPDLNACEFLLLGYLKQLFGRESGRTLLELIDNISCHAFNISKNLHRMTVGHIILDFKRYLMIMVNTMGNVYKLVFC